MKKLIIIFLIFLSILQINISAKNISVRFRTGYGFYDMKEMSILQIGLKDEIGIYNISPKVVDDFPPYLNFQIQSINNYGIFSYGIFLEKASTGGRITYSDYSGEISINSFVSRFSFGAMFEKNFYSYDFLNFYFCFQISYIHSMLEIEEFIEVYNQSQKTTSEFTSAGYGFEPGLGIQINYENFLFRPEIGFQFNSSEDFIYDKNENATLKGFSPEWMGSRYSLLFGYNF